MIIDAKMNSYGNMNKIKVNKNVNPKLGHAFKYSF